MSKTIIIGAGRIGSTIGRYLNNRSDVLIIDKDREKIERLVDYSGFVEVGDATDQSFLEKNGIREADTVVCLTDDDNVNIFLADLCCYEYAIGDIYVKLKDSRRKVLVNPSVKCICPFDLSLACFQQMYEKEEHE